MRFGRNLRKLSKGLNICVTRYSNKKVKASNYPEAEEILKKAADKAIGFIEENNGEASFTRDK